MSYEATTTSTVRLKKANKRLYAKGSKLIELASLYKGGPMIKAKRYLLKAREFLSNFKKVEKKGGPPKLKVTTKKRPST